MSDIGELIPYLLAVVGLVTASAFFSGTEVAMFSLRRVERQQLVRSPSRGDALITRMLARPRRLIATLLIGNEIVNVSVSAVVAAMVPYFVPGGTQLEMALIATFTAVVLLLFCGEITPKTVAIKSALGWSRRAARPLWLFGLLVSPIRVVVRLAADLVMRPFGGHALQALPKDMSEDEFIALVDAGSAHGEVNPRERRLIHKVFEFADKTVDQVMTPRDKIFALAYDLPAARLLQEIAKGGYARVPVYQKSLNRIRGIVYAKDLVVQGTGVAVPRRLVELLHEPLFVPRAISIERLFRIFKHRRTHMALVVDEYGRLLGLVTMEDLLEELFGEIHDEREQQKASVTTGVRAPAPGVTRPAHVRAADDRAAVVRSVAGSAARSKEAP